jgi:glycosyltransferase involved in cell wall biosynthesis
MTVASSRRCEAAAREKPCVAIVDRLVPHYRASLYQRLMSSDRAEYWIVAAAHPSESMHTVPYPNGWRWIDAPTKDIPGSGGRALWQWGAVRAGLSPRFNAILMMANPRDPALWLCAIAAKITGKRLLMWTHGYKRSGTPLLHRVRRCWHALADALLLYGHFGKVMCIRHGDPPEKCHVVYNSLDYDRQKAERDRLTDQRRADVRRELFGESHGPVVICISRFYQRKRVDLLLDAHAKLRQGHGIDAHVLLVGEGDALNSLQSQTERLGTGDSVHVVGPSYDEHRTAELISIADLCVAPTHIGLTAVHAMAYAVPVVTDDDIENHGPEFEAIIPGRTGAFYCAGCADDLAHVMAQWLLPMPRRREVANECIRMVERFYTPAVQAEAIERAVAGKPADDLCAAWASADMHASREDATSS